MTTAPQSSLAIELVPAVAAATLARLPAGDLPTLIDLRSPGEYAEDHVPGAVNVPLFDDEERALVGFLYVQRSPEEAFQQGRRIVLEKIEALVRSIGAVAGWPREAGSSIERVEAWTEGGIGRLSQELRTEPLARITSETLLLCCWRGGMRSRAVAALLRSLGHRGVAIVEGGYRSWRKQVTEFHEAWHGPPAFVLRGLTGVGKTLVLRAIERLRPGSTIDLEAHAGHRSSLLGMVGLSPCSQKCFDSRLERRLREPLPPAFLVEGESRKVGDVTVPRTLWGALAGGTNLLLCASVERRIDVLIADYLADERSLPKLREQLAAIEPRMPGRPKLVEMLDAGRVRELVALLLEDYYDPLYRHSEKGRGSAATFDVEDPERAARAIVEWVEARVGALVPSQGSTR